MPANNRKDMRLEEFLLLAIKFIQRVRQVWKVPRSTVSFSTFLGLALLLAYSTGCAPPYSPGDANQSSSDSAPADLPEITEELIRERINDSYVRKVPEENGTAEPIGWNFNRDEPKEIVVVEKKLNGTRATIVLDIKTRSAPGWRNPRELAGQIRTEWELKTGWALRQWEIIDTENISMKYKNIPKPPEQNFDR